MQNGYNLYPSEHNLKYFARLQSACTYQGKLQTNCAVLPFCDFEGKLQTNCAVLPFCDFEHRVIVFIITD